MCLDVRGSQGTQNEVRHNRATKEKKFDPKELNKVGKLFFFRVSITVDPYINEKNKFRRLIAR